MKYEIEFEIEDLPKTYNAIGRSHWTVKAKEAKKWRDLVTTFVGKRPEKPLSKARVTLSRFSSRCPDSDGLVHSFKHVLDGLQTCGVLQNDSYENIGMPTYLWEKTPKGKGKIKVKVEEL